MERLSEDIGQISYDFDNEVRCPCCGRLIAKYIDGIATVSIKCGKCGKIVTVYLGSIEKSVEVN